MNEQTTSQGESKTPVSAETRSQAWWQELQRDLAELRAFNAELAALSERRLAERDAARAQIEALRKALNALRELARHTSDAAVLQMSIEELADSAASDT
jgi:predicted nuclease with TOPRIM domain